MPSTSGGGGVAATPILLNLDTSTSSLPDLKKTNKQTNKRTNEEYQSEQTGAGWKHDEYYLQSLVLFCCFFFFNLSCGSQSSWLCLKPAFNSVAFYSKNPQTKRTRKLFNSWFFFCFVFCWMSSVCMLLSESKKNPDCHLKLNIQTLELIIVISLILKLQINNYPIKHNKCIFRADVNICHLFQNLLLLFIPTVKPLIQNDV